MKFAYLISISLFLSIQISAQVNPPTIRCITSDTLFFVPAMNDCGPFISYEVFKADNPNGPFSLLSTISNENTDFYIDANSANQISYYFIAANYNCTSGAILNSETISNRPPEVAPIQTVSVVNGETVITWEPSPSLETVFYTVFLITDAGLEFLTNTPNTTFTDALNNPNQESLSYLITANDDCGIQSVFGDPVSSILLNNNVDPCSREGSFSWTRHVNTERQELWAVDANGMNILLAEVPVDADNFLIESIPNVPLSGFFIRAFIDESQGQFADSNLSPTSTVVNNFLEEIFFSTVQTINDNSISLEWCWDQNADLAGYELLINSPTATNLITETISGNLPSEVTEIISVANTQEEAYLLEVSSLDVCGLTFNSPMISSIVLNVSPLDEATLAISWSEYEYAAASLINYVLHEVIDGEDNIIFVGLQNNFDRVRTNEVGEACYYVEAVAEGILLDGNSKPVSIISNTACSRGFPIIRLPNAFNPYGINSIFRPLFGNTDVIVGYDMRVFSRYGELLFSTNNLAEGWNGRDGLREMPQGVYSYLISVDVLGGETIMRQGSVLLIR